ncbi:hypothetical protein EOD00_37255, partial [Mesorhizobium sp. M7A.T.Ca.TU.009.01.3.1]
MAGGLWITGLSGIKLDNEIFLSATMGLIGGHSALPCRPVRSSMPAKDRTCMSGAGEGGYLKVGVVLNPIAGGGRLKRHWPD